MSKADTLLKKATAFERLALYSDRKTFLQSLAQTAPAAPGLDANSRMLVNQALQIMKQLGVDEEVTRPLADALIFNKVDPHAIQMAFQRARFTAPAALTSGPALEQLKNIVSQIKWPSTGQPEQPTDVGTGTGTRAPAAAQLPSIDKQLQKALFDYAIQVGGLGPDPEKQKADGVWGPETRKAIEGIRHYFTRSHPQNKPMSDQEVLNAVKFQGRQ